MNKWKTCLRSCGVLAGVGLAAFAVEMYVSRVQYFADLQQGGSAPFWVYALPAWVRYGVSFLALLGLGVFFWKKMRKEGEPSKAVPLAGKWKRGMWSCALLALVEIFIFIVHYVDLRTQYMIGVSQGWSTPFAAYALPAFVWHGVVLLLVLAVGLFCWRKARRETGVK